MAVTSAQTGVYLEHASADLVEVGGNSDLDVGSWDVGIAQYTVLEERQKADIAVWMIYHSSTHLSLQACGM